MRKKEEENKKREEEEIGGEREKWGSRNQVGERRSQGPRKGLDSGKVRLGRNPASSYLVKGTSELEPLLASEPHLPCPEVIQRQLRRPLGSRYHQLMGFPESPVLPKEEV